MPIALLNLTKRKRKYVEENTTKLKIKQTSIAKVRNHLRTFASLPPSLLFHYSLHLKNTRNGTSESKTTITFADKKFGQTPKTNLGDAKEVGQSVHPCS
jgi:hypothetical protein